VYRSITDEKSLNARYEEALDTWLRLDWGVPGERFEEVPARTFSHSEK
jgi:hypothetical protein